MCKIDKTRGGKREKTWQGTPSVAIGGGDLSPVRLSLVPSDPASTTPRPARACHLPQATCHPVQQRAAHAESIKLAVGPVFDGGRSLGQSERVGPDGSVRGLRICPRPRTGTSTERHSLGDTC
jgi:hypothetical protein